MGNSGICLTLVLALHVRSEGAPLCSSVPTSHNVSGKALPRVRAHVNPERAARSRSILTPNHLACKGALSRVSAHVIPESATL